jgi:hypothetical protein
MFAIGRRPSIQSFLSFCFLAWALELRGQTSVDENIPALPDPVGLFSARVREVTVQFGIDAAGLAGQEALILGSARTGLMGNEDAAARLYAVALTHWERRSYEDELRVLDIAIEQAPDSYAAAQAWLLKGETHLGNLVDPGTSIQSFREADRILESVLAQPGLLTPEARRDICKKRSQALASLGLAAMSSGDHELEEWSYQTIATSDELCQALEPTQLFEVYQRLLMRAADRNDESRARELGERLRGLANDENLSPVLSLSLRYRSVVDSFQDPFSAERIALLERIWKDKRFAGLDPILQVGGDLELVYWFAEPPKRDDFLRVAQEFQKRAEALGARHGDRHKRSLTPSEIRHALLVIDCLDTSAHHNLDPATLREELQRHAANADLALGVPGHFPEPAARRIAVRLLAITRRSIPSFGTSTAGTQSATVAP